MGNDTFFSDGILLGDLRSSNSSASALSDAQRSYVQQVKGICDHGRGLMPLLHRLQNLKVVVIGDTIIDEYVYCEPLGQSLKHPIVVHEYLREERFCGGVIAVANQVAEFCKEVQVVSVAGGLKSHLEYIHSSLRHNVSAKFFTRSDAPTVVKKRYVYENVDQKVFEICYINDADMPCDLAAEMCRYLAEIIGDFDLVMVSDYGHGAITEQIAAEAIRGARFLAVNAQTNSANMGYNLITKKYSSVSFACIDEAEARLALQDKHQDINTLGRNLVDKLQAGRLIITRGRNGSIGLEPNREPRIAPALATRVVDRVGAGDVFFALTGPCTAVGIPLDLVSFVGNAIGALAVQIVGNRQPVASTDLSKFITALLE